MLREHINSYEKLDLLLLLWRKQVALAVADLASALGLSQRGAREVLSQLAASELIIEGPPGHFRYRPRFAAQRAAVEGLAQLFEEDPVRIVQWMSRNAFDRLHYSAAGAFAEAMLTGRKKRE